MKRLPTLSSSHQAALTCQKGDAAHKPGRHWIIGCKARVGSFCVLYSIC